MLLKKMIKSISAEKVIGDLYIEIENVEIDSRKIRGKGMFIALKGYTVDGHDYIDQAIKNGAACIVSEKEMNVPKGITLVKVESTKKAMHTIGELFYGHPTSKMKLIGITGTNGKTTTANLIDFVLRDLGYTTGLIGTVEHRIAGETVDSQNTTPESLDLQKMFHQMLEKNVTHATMEVSSHGLEMNRVAGCNFDVAGFTNLTQDHLDFHPTFEDYKKAKGKLFKDLKGDATAVLNIDEEATSDYIKETSATVITYGIHRTADIQAKNVKLSSKGMEFLVVTKTKSQFVKTHLLGLFNVYNQLQAIGILLSVGIEMEQIVESLQKVRGVNGRMETVDSGQLFPVVVDYAHTPDALENVLKTIKGFTKGRVITVIGCGGNRDRGKRPIMASISETYSDLSIFTSDNPRKDDPEQILEDMMNGVKEKEKVAIITDRKEAIKKAINTANPNDVVLIAGKGHETYQIIGEKKYDFDDRLVAKEAIKERM